MRSAAGVGLSIIVLSIHGDAHSSQCQDGFFPSPLIPSGPAFGVQPCMCPRLGPERQDDGPRRLGLATPCAASCEVGTRVAVQPLDDTALECSGFGLNARQAAVILQKARAFIEK